MKLLLLDNNDSFTYNIVDLLRSFDFLDVEVIKSSVLEEDSLKKYDKIILSPGPGKPDDFPAIKTTIRFSKENKIPLLGICLGHQAICEYFGAQLFRMPEVIHGRKQMIKIKSSATLFRQLPLKIGVGLYHSWAVNVDTLPKCLSTVASSEQHILMAVQHTDLPIFGIQFHPESFITDFGEEIMSNFLNV